MGSADSKKTSARTFSWQHAAGIVVTAGLLWFVFRKIPLAALGKTIARTDPIWFLLGFIIYGVSLFFGACRWHLALHLTRRALHLLASYRVFLVGHFMYCVLFGAVGGDLGKSTVYARWFRFALPEVLAAAPLDRLLGMGGTSLYIIGTVLIAWHNRGFDFLKQSSPHLSAAWAAVGALVFCGLVVAFLRWRPSSESGLGRAVQAFKAGSSKMLVTPEVLVPGTLCGILCQVGLTSIMAVNLRAVTQQDLPWGPMTWTFPVILVAGAMPFTVAGAGAREMAAVALLGLFGVPAEECVAASLLTLAHKLVWALIGSIILWRDGAFYARFKDREGPRTISLVIPALSDPDEIAATLSNAQANPEIKEIIALGTGSAQTVEIAASRGCIVRSAGGTAPFQSKPSERERLELAQTGAAHPPLPKGEGRGDGKGDVAQPEIRPPASDQVQGKSPPHELLHLEPLNRPSAYSSLSSTNGGEGRGEEAGCSVQAEVHGEGNRGVRPPAISLQALAQEATGDVVLILKRGALLSPYAGLATLNCLRDPYVVAGGFWKKIADSPFRSMISRLVCVLRLLIPHRIGADQGLFIRREALMEIGDFPCENIFESAELSRRLRGKGSLALADAVVIAPN